MTYLIRRTKLKVRPEVALYNVDEVRSVKAPELNILALGAKEAGKTVLLAAMYNRFGANGGLRSVRLNLPNPVDAIYLNQVWSGIEEGKWPGSTRLGSIRTFTFECLGEVEGNSYPVLRFNYEDYAGEVMDGHHTSIAHAGEHDQTAIELQEKIERAHVVFGIINGRRVADYLAGKPAGNAYMQSGILPMVTQMLNLGLDRPVRQGRAILPPIYFVVAQWDVVAPDAEHDAKMYMDVWDALLRQPAFRNLFRMCKRRQQAFRLIPVSAFGRGFASVNSATGTMECNSNGHRPNPFNIEFPLCAVIPDIFVQIEAALDDEVRSKVFEELRKQPVLRSSGQASVRFLRSPAGRVVIAALGATFVGMGSDAIMKLLEIFLEWFAERARIGGPVSSTDFEGRARREVIKRFSDRMIVLEDRYPDSDPT